MTFNVTDDMLNQLAELQGLDITKLTLEEQELLVRNAITKDYEKLQDG